MTDIRERTSTTVKVWLLQNNIRQADLARALNISRTAISSWVKGAKTPDPGLLLRAAKSGGPICDLAVQLLADMELLNPDTKAVDCTLAAPIINQTPPAS